MERLMQHLACGMAEYADLTVIGPRGCAQSLPVNVQVYETSDKLATFLLCSTWLGIKVCSKREFDIVIGGSGLIAPTLRILSLIFRCKTAIYLHGLDIIVDNYWYQQIFVPCLQRVYLTIVNSRNTRKLAIDKGVKETRITVVNPGTDISEMPAKAALKQFRLDHDISFSKIMIFVGRMTRRKGLSAFIEKCLPSILAKVPDAGLIVVGDNPQSSLNHLGEEREIVAKAAESEHKNRIVFLGRLNDNDLATCYALADVQILPLREVDGDIEGFGMVAIEAAALGTPTVAFALGGVSDAISPANGLLVAADRYDLYAEAISDILSQAPIDYASCRRHAENFSWVNVNAQFRQALAEIIRC